MDWPVMVNLCELYEMSITNCENGIKIKPNIYLGCMTSEVPNSECQKSSIIGGTYQDNIQMLTVMLGSPQMHSKNKSCGPDVECKAK